MHSGRRAGPSPGDKRQKEPLSPPRVVPALWLSPFAVLRRAQEVRLAQRVSVSCSVEKKRASALFLSNSYRKQEK